MLTVTDPIQAGLQLLRSHFGPSAIVAGRPASAKEISTLTKAMKGLPQGLEELLTTFDGLSIKEIDYHIMSSAEIRRTVGGKARKMLNPFTRERVVMEPPSAHPHRVPIGDHTTGDYDWVLRNVPIGAGSVVNNDQDQEEGGLTFMASSVATYFYLWSMHITARYDRGGALNPGARSATEGPAAWPHGGKAFLYAHDPEANRLLEDGGFLEILGD